MAKAIPRDRRAELLQEIRELLSAQLGSEMMREERARRCVIVAGQLVDRFRGTDDAIRAVLNSIRDAISEEPKKDWRDSLADAADCLEAIRCR